MPQNALLKSHSTKGVIKHLKMIPGVDPGWSVRGGVEAKSGRKGADIARFWLILDGAVPSCPPSGSATGF